MPASSRAMPSIDEFRARLRSCARRKGESGRRRQTHAPVVERQNDVGIDGVREPLLHARPSVTPPVTHRRGGATGRDGAGEGTVTSDGSGSAFERAEHYGWRRLVDGGVRFAVVAGIAQELRDHERDDTRGRRACPPGEHDDAAAVAGFDDHATGAGRRDTDGRPRRFADEPDRASNACSSSAEETAPRPVRTA